MCSDMVAAWHTKKSEWNVFPAHPHGPSARDGATLIDYNGELILVRPRPCPVPLTA